MDVRAQPAPSPGDVLGSASARIPFRVDDRPVTCADALESLALRGRWVGVLDDVRRGAASLAAADEGELSRIEAELPAQESALRRRLHLTAADDYLAWLHVWELEVGDCRDHLRRRIATSTSRQPTTEPEGATTLDAVRAHVVIEGVLEAAVQRLAEDAALAAAAGVPVSAPDWLAQVVAVAARERSSEPDPRTLEEVVAEHKVDWTLVEATVVVVADDDVAHELLLCVHDRRAPLRSVAQEVGLDHLPCRTSLDRLEPWLEPVLMGAEPGALLGPVSHPEGRALVELHGRTAASALDDDVRRRAADLLLERRIALAMSSAVRWSADA